MVRYAPRRGRAVEAPDGGTAAVGGDREVHIERQGPGHDKKIYIIYRHHNGRPPAYRQRSLVQRAWSRVAPPCARVPHPTQSGTPPPATRVGGAPRERERPAPEASPHHLVARIDRMRGLYIHGRVRAVASTRLSVSRRLPTDSFADDAVSCGPGTAPSRPVDSAIPSRGEGSKARINIRNIYNHSSSSVIELCTAHAEPPRSADERARPPTARRQRRLVGRRPRRPASSDRWRGAEPPEIYNRTIVNLCGPAGVSDIEKFARRN
jgi:hypothetical protein